MSIPMISNYEMPSAANFPTNKTSWQVDPKRSVLLIHDMQNYFLRFYDRDASLVKTLIANLSRARDWAHENQVPVFYTAQPRNQPPSDRALLNDMWGPGLTVVDPELQKVVAELEPTAEDFMLTKWRYSAFKRSDLLQQMQAMGRDQIIIGGVYAHIGCMTTALDAFMSDIQAFFLGDALADFSEEEHRMALQYVATRCGAVIETASLRSSDGQENVEQWLKAYVAEMIDEEGELDPDENLVLYGLDSLQVMKLNSAFKEKGFNIGFDELLSRPTLNGWLDLINRGKRAA